MIEQDQPGRTTDVRVRAFDGAAESTTFDTVVTEEPLELRLLFGARVHSLAVTMRTPGNDFELAAGFIAGEQLIAGCDDLAGITYCVDADVDVQQRYNIVNVALTSAEIPALERFERHFTMNSSCGVCGRAQLETLEARGLTPVADDARISIQTVYAMPDRMREAQRVFSTTGGLHAAALFDLAGEPVAVREDVGRHNAVDKLTGWALLEGRSLQGTVLFVSGRTSYEIVQKAAVARVPVVCAVSAPSSLAVALAERFNITLLGFVRGGRANVYTNAQRITA
ncbi:MAG TPA: formate dehydrogenase accessory sulfurtransferase FdhD [Candidatus Baltobacteraceae bacterium]|jgi:FdhD protein|nr:formate dehydrogenase accessory sulfurtransferase FdhD [Candidatus Baltobacteraceae bacterium]